jgi:hypothetical protein
VSCEDSEAAAQSNENAPTVLDAEWVGVRFCAPVVPRATSRRELYQSAEKSNRVGQPTKAAH